MRHWKKKTIINKPYQPTALTTLLAMAKQILVTTRNLHLINYRLQQFLNRNQCVSMQGFYRYATTKRYNQMINPTKHIERKVEKTAISYMVSGDAKFEVVRKDKCEGIMKQFVEQDFIRINYAQGSCGFMIELGCKISFMPTRIVMNKKGPISRESEKMEGVWLPADVRKGESYSQMEKHYTDDYYATCDEEYNEQKTQEELEDDGMVVNNPEF